MCPLQSWPASYLCYPSYTLPSVIFFTLFTLSILQFIFVLFHIFFFFFVFSLSSFSMKETCINLPSNFFRCARLAKPQLSKYEDTRRDTSELVIRVYLQSGQLTSARAGQSPHLFATQNIFFY